MMERKSGHIVVISSVQGKLGLPLRTSCMPTDIFTTCIYIIVVYVQILPLNMLYKDTLIP